MEIRRKFLYRLLVLVFVVCGLNCTAVQAQVAGQTKQDFDKTKAAIIAKLTELNSAIAQGGASFAKLGTTVSSLTATAKGMQAPVAKQPKKVAQMGFGELRALITAKLTELNSVVAQGEGNFAQLGATLGSLKTIAQAVQQRGKHLALYNPYIRPQLRQLDKFLLEITPILPNLESLYNNMNAGSVAKNVGYPQMLTQSQNIMAKLQLFLIETLSSFGGLKAFIAAKLTELKSVLSQGDGSFAQLGNTINLLKTAITPLKIRFGVIVRIHHRNRLLREKLLRFYSFLNSFALTELTSLDKLNNNMRTGKLAKSAGYSQMLGEVTKADTKLQNVK